MIKNAPPQTVKEWLDIKLFVANQGVAQVFVQDVWLCNDACFSDLEALAQDNEHTFGHYSSAPEGPHFKFMIRIPQNYDAIKQWCENAKNAGKFKHFALYAGSHDVSRDDWLRGKKLWDKTRSISNDDPVAFARSISPLAELKTVGAGFHPFCNMLGLTYGAEDLLRSCLGLANNVPQDWILLPLAAHAMWESGRKK